MIGRFLKVIAIAAVAIFSGAASMAQDAEPTVTPDNVLVIELSNGGKIRIAMRPDKAPKHVERIKTLAREGFYNGTKFHRVIEDFMAQGGDPTGTGMGGSKLADLPAEFNDLPHLRGTLSMARSNSPNSANSQFFICFAPTPYLDGQYTAWGRVVEGMDAVDTIERGEPPANPTKIAKAYIESDGK
jgi:cyclophilin family peptidyl-prolyl cis-trans isomerase